MNPARFALLAAAVVAAGWPLLHAQQVGLKRVPAPQDGRTEVDPWSAEDWRRDLSVADLEQREQHFERLVQSARRDPEGRERLEEWSRDADTGFAWTARLALREVEHRGLFPGAIHTFGNRGGFQFHFPQLGVDGFDIQMPDWEGDTFELQPPDWQFELDDAQPGDSVRNSSKVQLSITPDGVHATVTTDEDGVEQTREYSAESMDALLEAHPELEDDLGNYHVGGNRTLRGFRFSPNTTFGLRGGLELSPFDTFEAPGVPGVPGLGRGFTFRLGKPRTDVLGVYVMPAQEAAEQAEQPLPVDHGMWIQKIEPGTIAAELGLERGQTLIRIDSTTISGREDISAAMQAHGADAVLEVEVVEPDGERRTLRWEPPKAPALRKV